ncbi:glycosyltransferase family 39 protein [Candidatus Poribacteria bacterium]|nr:glycosyltransferase family 39 protein [Candidatus Poribacteria bacterium]
MPEDQRRESEGRRISAGGHWSSGLFLSGRRPLFFVFLLALAVRAAFVLLRPPDASAVLTRLNDSTDYDLLARHVLAGLGFTNQNGNPSVLRPPLYPVFMAGVYAIGGAGNLLAVTLAQAVLGAMNSVFVLLIARRAGFGERAALVAGGVAALYPVFVFQSALVLTEVVHRTVMLLAVVGMMAALGRECRGESKKQGGTESRSKSKSLAGIEWLTWIAAGGAFGLCLLSKPAMIATVPFVALWLLLVRGDGVANPLRRRALRAAVALGMAGLVVGVWTLRNAAVTGRFVPVAANFQVTAAHGTSRFGYYANQRYGTERLLEVPDDFLWLTQLRAYEDARAELATQDEWGRRVRGFAAANPGLYVELSLRRCLHFWSPSINNRSRAARLAALLTMGPVLLLGWIGIVLSLLRRMPGRALAWLCLAIGAGVTLPHALSMPDVRYRTAFVDPLWIPFAAAMVIRIYDLALRRRGGADCADSIGA